MLLLVCLSLVRSRLQLILQLLVIDVVGQIPLLELRVLLLELMVLSLGLLTTLLQSFDLRLIKDIEILILIELEFQLCNPLEEAFHLIVVTHFSWYLPLSRTASQPPYWS